MTDTIQTSGKRKTAVARIVLKKGKGLIRVNGKTVEDYFQNEILYIETIKRPLMLTEQIENLDVKARIAGGGISAQAGALRHAIAKALVDMNENNRKILKSEGMLTRDPRMKERKKTGLKKARKRGQFSKR